MWQSHSNTVPDVQNVTLLFQYIGEEKFVESLLQGMERSNPQNE